LKIVALSSICIDYYPEKQIAVPGGNSLNFAIQIRRLGEENIAVIGFIGNDSAGDKILELCRNEGIDTRFLVQMVGSTASNKIYVTADGERYSKPGEWQNGVKDDGSITELAWNFICSCDIISIPYNDRHLTEIIRRRNKHQFLSVDFMHFDSYYFIGTLLSSIDIAFVSPRPETIPSLKTLANTLNKPVIAMLGAEGSIAYFHGKEYRQKAVTTEKVIDTTGCGDAYQAAFCYAIHHSSSIGEAMELATNTATKVLKGYGGVF
jgi:fructoselysine 6-kinase